METDSDSLSDFKSKLHNELAESVVGDFIVTNAEGGRGTRRFTVQVIGIARVGLFRGVLL